MEKNKIYSDSKAKEILGVCETLYNGGGIQSIIDYADILELNYSICIECNAAMPIIETETNTTCCVCGSEVK